MIEILMPRISKTMETGVLVSWEKELGDKVEPGDVLFETEANKVVCEVEVNAQGCLAQVFFEEGETVPVGAVVARVQED